MYFFSFEYIYPAIENVTIEGKQANFTIDQDVLKSFVSSTHITTQ